MKPICNLFYLLACIFLFTSTAAYAQTLSFSEDITAETDTREITIYTNNTSINLDDYDVFYTLNGTRPTPTNGIKYSDPFIVSQTTRIMAAIYDKGTPLTGLVHSYNVAKKSVLVGYSTQTQGTIHAMERSLRNIRAIAAGEGFTVVAAGPWDVRMYGSHISANSAFESLSPEDPDPVNTPSTIDIDAGGHFGLALLSNGTVVGWGDNSFGQANPPSLTQVIAIAAGGSHALALHANGTVSAWGLNWFDQAKVPNGLDNVIAIDAGEFFSVALHENGTVTVWGNNESGVLDIPSGLTDVVQISAGPDHILALKSDGSVIGWGSNLGGRHNIPSGLPPVAQIAAGERSFIRTNSGAVYQVANNTLTPFNHTEGIIQMDASLTHIVMLLDEAFYQSPDFVLDLFVKDYEAAHPNYSSNPGLVRPLQIGTTELLSDIENLNRFAPPPPPSGDSALDAYIFFENNYYFTYYQLTTTTENRWSIAADVDDGYYFIDWDPASLQNMQGSLIARYQFQEGVITSINLRTGNRIAAISGTVVEIIHYFEQDLEVTYNAGFQLVSNPTFDPITDVSSVFYPAQANSLYAFSGVYTDETELDTRRGYWLRFPQQTTVQFTPPLRPYQVLGPFESGWHIISSLGYNFSVEDIQDPASILVSGTVYGYDQGYKVVSSLEPGRGYWIRINSTSTNTLVFDATAAVGTQPKQALPMPEGFTQLSLQHKDIERIFYLDGNLSTTPAINPMSFELPPIPPSEAFDVRFANQGTLTESTKGTIRVQSPGDMLLLRNVSEVPRRISLQVITSGNSVPEAFILDPGEELTLHNPHIKEISVESLVLTSVDDLAEGIPAQVTLNNNYPNPFNPTTSIEYALPLEGMVTLTVYDMLGRQVSVLVNEHKSAGYHQVTFNATGLASGLYLYRLEANGSVINRQMMLVK